MKKSVFITGAQSGTGYAIAEHCHYTGALTDIRPAKSEFYF